MSIYWSLLSFFLFLNMLYIWDLLLCFYYTKNIKKISVIRYPFILGYLIAVYIIKYYINKYKREYTEFLEDTEESKEEYICNNNCNCYYCIENKYCNSQNCTYEDK